MHDVDDSVDTNADYYYNDVTQEYGYTINTEYDDLVEVRMDCTNDCVCTFEKTNQRKFRTTCTCMNDNTYTCSL